METWGMDAQRLAPWRRGVRSCHRDAKLFQRHGKVGGQDLSIPLPFLSHLCFLSVSLHGSDHLPFINNGMESQCYVSDTSMVTQHGGDRAGV